MSFITQFKIEVLLPFTNCRKMRGKMFAYYRSSPFQGSSFSEILYIFRTLTVTTKTLQR